jgi:hypothetical protein
MGSLPTKSFPKGDLRVAAGPEGAETVATTVPFRLISR